LDLAINLQKPTQNNESNIPAAGDFAALVMVVVAGSVVNISANL